MEPSDKGASAMAMMKSQSSRSHLTIGDMYRLASDFAEEHGNDACDYAYRAVISFEAEGEGERAYFWFLLLVMMGDIVSHRIDPDGVITIH
jgi:hypothetical protein